MSRDAVAQRGNDRGQIGNVAVAIPGDDQVIDAEICRIAHQLAVPLAKHVPVGRHRARLNGPQAGKDRVGLASSRSGGQWASSPYASISPSFTASIARR